MGPDTLASILTVATVAATAAGALGARLLARRSASGRVGTSEASVLWSQSQDMRSTLLEEKHKAEEQRDRLIESYTTQVFPALSSINQLVQDLSAAVAEALGTVRGIAAAMEKEGEHVASSPARVSRP